jgi:ATP-dependent helicase/nuclease subunit B
VVRSVTDDGPAQLSEAAQRAVLSEAIARTGADGLLGRIQPVAETRGFRRRLRQRLAEWTRDERDGSTDSPEPDDEVIVAESAIFRHYRRILESLGAEDEAGFVVWASKSLRTNADRVLRTPGPVVFLEPVSLDKARWRAFHAIQDRAGSILVTLPWTDPTSREDVVAPLAPIRDRLLEAEFVESLMDGEAECPTALRTLRKWLFREDLKTEDRATDAAGFRVLGAPAGEGHGLIVASRVQEILDGGSEPGEIVIVVRRWSDSAEIVLQTLRSWDIPATAEARSSLAREPSISALLLAASLAVHDWETGRVVRLLRNRQVQPSWPELWSPHALAEAAAIIQSLRVYRGLGAIQSGLNRSLEPPNERVVSALRRRAFGRATTVLKLINRLASLIPNRDTSGPWRSHVERLRALATELRIGTGAEAVGGQDAALEELWLALEEHGSILADLGRGDEPWTWSNFLLEVERATAELRMPQPRSRRGAVRIVTLDEYQGAACQHLIIASLTEGTFPEASDADLNGSSATSLFDARESSSFLRLVASARQSLTLAFPSTDEKGTALLPASFLDDVKGCFEENAWKHASITIDRLDPIMPESLARSAADVRVRALALAFGAERREAESLRQLSRAPEHRDALNSVATALRVSHIRSQSREYGPFDGKLTDPAAVHRIAESFGPNRPAFSPSHLETLALCPFQFYVRYVLRLTPVEELGEMEEDRAARGTLIHKALQNLHERLRDTGQDEAIEQAVANGVEAAIRAELDSEREPRSDFEAGLREIFARRLIRLGQQYSRQFEAYRHGKLAPGLPYELEVSFGKKTENSKPALVLGSGPNAVRIQGTIDRIDRVEEDGSRGFRVIDYKSGSAPGVGDVKSGLALQLPLYALAVERTGLAEEASDFGYWSLKSDGFRAVKLGKQGEESQAWHTYRERLEDYVVELVDWLRQAMFPVSPRIEECASHCDFSQACRIKQIRSLSKSWVEAPKLEPPK